MVKVSMRTNLSSGALDKNKDKFITKVSVPLNLAGVLKTPWMRDSLK
jgi:hypothetical protein